jgi:hypothetical protein
MAKRALWFPNTDLVSTTCLYDTETLLQILRTVSRHLCAINIPARRQCPHPEALTTPNDRLGMRWLGWGRQVNRPLLH